MCAIILCRLDYYLHGGSEMDILYVIKQKIHTRSSPNRQHGGMLSKMFIHQTSLYLSCFCLLPLTLAPTYVCLLRTTHNRRFINKANIHCLIIMVYVKVRWHGSTHRHGHRVIQNTNTPATFWQKTTASKCHLELSLIRENEIKYTICRTQSSVTRMHIYICDIKTTYVAPTITESAMVQYNTRAWKPKRYLIHI